MLQLAIIDQSNYPDISDAHDSKAIYLLTETSFDDRGSPTQFLDLMQNATIALTCVGRADDIQFHLVDTRGNRTVVGHNPERSWEAAWDKVDVNLSGPITTINWLVQSKYCVSDGEARRLIKGGGVYFRRGSMKEFVQVTNTAGVFRSDDEIKIGRRGRIHDLK